MASFLDFLLPKNTGLDPQQIDYADRQGLLAMGSILSSLSADSPNNVGVGPMQLIANGLTAYSQGANTALDRAYDLPAKRAAAVNAKVQEAYDTQNLDWFNRLPTTAFPTVDPGMSTPSAANSTAFPAAMPTLASFYSDPLTRAQIKQESNFNPTAVSPKGAYGLMQIMPDTGKDPGLGVTPLRNNSKEENVRLGVDYRNALLKKYNGNTELALMAYNWGLKNVDDWLASGADPRKVPKETQDYVTNILGSVQQGAQSQPQNPADRFYNLAEMQMRAGRAGADTLFSLGSKYDPSLAAINKTGMPAVLQVADALASARASGNQQRVDDITALSKVYDKGIVIDPNTGQAVNIDGYTNARRDLKRAEGAGEQEGKGSVQQLQAQAAIVAKMPLLENDLNMYKTKLSNIDPALMGPIRGTASYYLDPQIQDLTSNARSIALQLKDIYNLGSGQGFTDADRNYLDSIIGGAKVDPVAATQILEDMYKRIQVQKDMYQQQIDFYNQNGSTMGFVPQVQTPTAPVQNQQFQTTPSGVKYRIVQ